MADLDVQPKKRSSILPWLLLALGVIALIVFLARRNNDDVNETTTAATTPTNTTTATSTTSHAAASTTDWNNVDFNAPTATYDEISDRNISVRGNENYGVYSLGEGLLFDEGKSTLRPDAARNLQQIAASIGKRYTNGEVRIYGYTDATGSAGANKQLAEQRAAAVRNWLSQNSNITADRISLHPVGEEQPVAANNTSAGRQQNRRVDIVARRS